MSLPSSWATAPLHDIATTTSGGTPNRSRASYYGGMIPWVKSGELGDRLVTQTEETITEEGLANSSAKIFPKDTLCIALYGATVGKLGILEIEAATNQAVCGIFPSADIRNKYLFYFLQSIRKALIASSQGGAQPNISQAIVRAIEIPIAPTAEQSRTVDEIEKQLTRLDDAVAALKRVQANLKRYRASVLKAACEGHLVPTEAELARKEGRDYEPASELLKRILAQRRAKWEADQLQKMIAAGKPPKNDGWKKKYKEPGPPDTPTLSKLPEGWTWAGWEQVGFSQNGRPFPSKQYKPEGVKLLRPGNLYPDGTVRWNSTNTRFLPPNFATANSDLLVHAEELIINLTAQSLKDEFLGRVCLTRSAEYCLLNQRLARLTPIFVSPQYLLWMFKSEIFRRFVNKLNTGSLIQHMFTSQLSEFVFPLPPAQEQKRIVAAIEEKLSSIQQVESACTLAVTRAHSLWAATLRAAFQGKLVPQHPNDEPASVLLDRIRAERATAAANRNGIPKTTTPAAFAGPQRRRRGRG